MSPTVQPYALLPRVERAAAYYTATSVRFFEVVGHALEADRFADLAARHVLGAAQQLGLLRTKPPASALAVLQQLRNRVEEGRLTYEELVAASDLVDRLEDDPRRDLEQTVIDTVVPVVRRVLEQQIALTAADDYSNRRAFEKTEKLIERSRSLGSVDDGLGDGPEAAPGLITHIRDAEKLSTGVTEIDSEIGGGLICGCLGLWLGSTGHGKSMGLNQIVAASLLAGLNVAYATLELPSAFVYARTFAALLDRPIDEVIANGATEEVDAIARLGGMGNIRVKEFTPLVTTMANVATWVDRVEQALGWEVDVLVTDYGDKLGAARRSGKKSADDTGYRTGLYVVEEMRGWAKERMRWHWSASQGTRREKGKKKLLDADDTADSLHKARSSDLMISVNLSEEGDEATYKIAKGRYGGQGKTVGPLPVDFAYGRLGPLPAQVRRA